MNLLAFFNGKKTYLVSGVICALVFGVWQGWWKVPSEAYAALTAMAIMALRSGVAREIGSMTDEADHGTTGPQDHGTPPTAPATATTAAWPGAAGKTIASALILCLFTASMFMLPGCASLQPGADPLVVRVEQAETSGKALLDAVVHVEGSDLPFFRTNAPGFYSFCEWLKAPQVVTGAAAGPATLPRGLALLWSLDQVKAGYKAGVQSSNTLITALTTFEAASSQASAWLTLATNNTAH